MPMMLPPSFFILEPHDSPDVQLEAWGLEGDTFSAEGIITTVKQPVQTLRMNNNRR